MGQPLQYLFMLAEAVFVVICHTTPPKDTAPGHDAL